jgi:OOP family OmpA-OmpF porin
MSAPRRESGAKASTSADRVWQVYADRVGIPGGITPVAEPLTIADDAPRRRGSVARVVARTIGGLVAILVVVVVTAVGGVIVWRSLGRSPQRVDPPRSTTVASTPVREAATPVREVAPPVQEVAPPVREATTPVPEVAPPMREVAPPVREAATPVREVAPLGEAAPPVREVTPPAKEATATRIPFEFDSDELSGEAKTSLQRVVVALKSNPEWRVAIEGHTDALGPADHNLSLSERRARAVKSYLESAGIAAGRLTITAFGALRPMAPNNPAGNVLNRRVDVRRY